MLHSSDIRSIIRSHVLQIDLTSYLKSTNLSNLDSFVSALFASMYDLALQNLRHWRSLHESFRIRIAERALEVTSLRESADSNDSHSHSSIDQESIALKEFARKLQNLHRWRSFRTRRFERASELVALKKLQNSSLWESFRTDDWKSLYESFRHHDICSRQKTQTEDTNECCEKVLKVQSSQMLQSRNHLIETDERKTNAFLLRLASRHCTQKCFRLSVS